MNAKPLKEIGPAGAGTSKLAERLLESLDELPSAMLRLFELEVAERRAREIDDGNC